MKIYSLIETSIETGEVLREESFEWDGPIAMLGDGGMVPDIGGGVGVVDAPEGGEPSEEEPAPEGEETPAEEPTEGGEEPAEGEPAEEPTAEEPEPTPPAAKEPMPAEISKVLRELKTANQERPEVVRTLKKLNDEYYTSRAFKSVYANPDEARTDKALLVSAGGRDGITSMREEIGKMSQFDQLAEEGDPRVIRGLANQFPDGFKRLVPESLKLLRSIDDQAYKDTMRAPLLQMLEGDGVMDVVAQAMELMNGIINNPEDPANKTYIANARAQLGRITAYYAKLQKEEKDVQERYRDPRLNELEQGNKALQQREINLHKETVDRGLKIYRETTMRPGVDAALRGRKLEAGGRARFEKNVREEISALLMANDSYKRSLNDHIRQGQVEEAEEFAKPFIDAARKKAIATVARDLYGNNPAPKLKPRTTTTTTQQTTRPTAVQNKPEPVFKRPSDDMIDWARDPKFILFATGQAYLKGSGKLVKWRQ